MSTRPARTIVVLGGGVGGFTAARQLARRLKGRHRVVLVERKPVQHFGAGFTWVMTGYRQAADVARDVRAVLPEGVDLVEATVEGLDLARGTVSTTTGPLAFDYLVVALGAESALDAVPGLANAHTFYDADGAARLFQALESFGGGSVGITVPAVPYKCPAAPYDAALLLHAYFERRGIRGKVDIQVYTPEPSPLPITGPAVVSAVSGLLKDGGITFNGGYKLKAVDAASRQLCFANLVRARFDLLITVPVHHPPQAVKGSAIAGPSGWVAADRDTLRTSVPNVYAVGDATLVPIMNGKFAVPKAGVFAHAEAETVAAHLSAELLGSGEMEPFTGEGGCFLSADVSQAAFIQGSFLKEPAPEVQFKAPSRVWHAQKALLISRWQKGQF